MANYYGFERSSNIKELERDNCYRNRVYINISSLFDLMLDPLFCTFERILSMTN
jgi:hypothetical protein